MPFLGSCFSVVTWPSSERFSPECIFDVLTVAWSFERFEPVDIYWKKEVFSLGFRLCLDYALIDRIIGCTFQRKNCQHVNQRCANCRPFYSWRAFHLDRRVGDHRGHGYSLVTSRCHDSPGDCLHVVCGDPANHLWKMHAIDMVRRETELIHWLMLPRNVRSRTKRVRKTDLRIKLMNEIVKSIHLVKMYVWEQPFQLKVERVRR